MTILVEHIIVAEVENHPPMLEKSMYDSRASRIHLFIKGVKHVKPQSQAKFPQLDSGLAVLVFQQGEDSINFINKALAFMSVVASREIATMSKGNYAAGQPRVVKCYNCQGEGHMVRQCSQPKRLRNSAWFKEKLMLDEAQEAGQILDEEQLAFLADLGMDEALVVQQTIP
uniref:Retrovirus-related Pol polyprotein from transposon TNT 1-94 n=1 Tax=Tanacetum cinerariifolium TaxID=118510 RepID=A0A6L2M3L8_TANCI|nr:retrovirus-related Pol polyprotein from transposon TNT 1-94 [Tanacetum cinerariifolium]